MPRYIGCVHLNLSVAVAVSHLTLSVQPTSTQIKETCFNSDCQNDVCCIAVTTIITYSYLLSSQKTNLPFISQPQTITDIIATNIVLSTSESTYT